MSQTNLSNLYLTMEHGNILAQLTMGWPLLSTSVQFDASFCKLPLTFFLFCLLRDSSDVSYFF